MKKYYKTPDVIFVDSEGFATCTLGTVVVDTALMNEEENRLMLILVNKLGLIKCAAHEVHPRVVPTPCGCVHYSVKPIIDTPCKVKEPFCGVFEFVDRLAGGERCIDTNADIEDIGDAMYKYSDDDEDNSL